MSVAILNSSLGELAPPLLKLCNLVRSELILKSNKENRDGKDELLPTRYLQRSVLPDLGCRIPVGSTIQLSWEAT